MTKVVDRTDLDLYNDRCKRKLEELIKQQSLVGDMIANGVPYDEVGYSGVTGSTWFSVTQYKTITKEEMEELGHNSTYVIDEDATVKVIASIVQWARKRGYAVEKEYDDAEFRVFVKVDSDTRLRFSANRQVVCKKVVTGHKVIPARTEEIVEWDCTKIAFTNVEL